MNFKKQNPIKRSSILYSVASDGKGNGVAVCNINGEIEPLCYFGLCKEWSYKHTSNYYARVATLKFKNEKYAIRNSRND